MREDKLAVQELQLLLLQLIRRWFVVHLVRAIEHEELLVLQAEDVAVGQEEAAGRAAHGMAVPGGDVHGKVLGVDERSDLAGVVAVEYHGVDAEVPARDVFALDDVVAFRGPADGDHLVAVDGERIGGLSGVDIVG